MADATLSSRSGKTYWHYWHYWHSRDGSGAGLVARILRARAHTTGRELACRFEQRAACARFQKSALDPVRLDHGTAGFVGIY